MTTKKTYLAAAAILTLAAPMAAAQDGWGGDVEAGVVLTSGNSEERNISTGADITRDWTDWRQNVSFESRYTEQSDERTAERYSASTQLDYKFTGDNYLFLRASYDNDNFNAFQFQASTIGGYGRRIWKEGESYLDASVGAGYRFSRLKSVDPDTGRNRREDPTGRLAGDFRYQLSPTASFRQKAETEIGLDEGEYVARSVTSVRANLMESLAIRVSYTVERESDVPEGFKNTDTMTTLTLLYSF